jgi:AraC family transcriptional regulator
MEPKIEILVEKKLIGKRMTMSLSNNKTGKLWRSFMSKRKEIQNNLTSDMISMQVYDQPVELGNLEQKFEKWAATEVSDFETIPDGMETFTVPSGLYAVFHEISAGNPAACGGEESRPAGGGQSAMSPRPVRR